MSASKKPCQEPFSSTKMEEHPDYAKLFEERFAEFFTAISEGNTQHVSDPMNFVLFAQATQETRYDILQLFLDHGWDINTECPTDSMIPSALVHTFHDKELAKWFLEHGADPNKRCQMRDATPLSYAVSEAPLEIIELFFEYGGSTTDGQLLHHASMRKDRDGLEVLKYLCDKDRQILNRVNFLLDEGHPEYWMNYRFGIRTPVQYAACAGSLQSVKFLVEQGGDPWRLDPYGKTALSYAVRHNHELVEQYLDDLKRQSVL